MSENGYVCDGNCPSINTDFDYFNHRRCCCGCKDSRKLFSELHPELKGLWTDSDGYWGEYGCKLPRNQYPEECKEFDCRNKVYYFRVAWSGDIGRSYGKFCVAAVDDSEVYPLWEIMRNKVLEINGVKDVNKL